MFSRRDVWIGVALVVAIVAVYLGGLALAPSGAEFVGTDAAAVDLAGGPTLGPLLNLSPELESGLFALQAGVGGILLGFVIGRLTARRPS